MAQLLPKLLLSAALLAPTPSIAADLTIWWDKGYYPQEDRALEAVVAAYEQGTGKDVDLVLYAQPEHLEKLAAAVAAKRPPDLSRSILVGQHLAEWARDGVLADLSEVVEPIKDQFYPGALESVLLSSGQTNKFAYYAVPLGQYGFYVHVWKSLLDQAGMRLEDVPRGWEAFWSFWCDKVQPAVRKATGRDDIWGIGLPMSVEGTDTESGLLQFMHAYEVELIAADGQPRLDDPAVRQKVIRALTDYTTVHRKGCTPPDAVHWGDPDNNKNFHDQKVVMTINTTLSIPNAMIGTRPDDYYKNTTTLAWPDGPDGSTYMMETGILWAIVFQQASNAEQAKDFLRFLLSEERLGIYLEASLARALPTMPALLDRPFWKDPADPHRRRAVEQLNLPSAPFYANVNWRYGRVEEDEVWQKAVHRVAVDGLSPEQAADEAIARVKQILSE